MKVLWKIVWVLSLSLIAMSSVFAQEIATSMDPCAINAIKSVEAYFNQGKGRTLPATTYKDGDPGSYSVSAFPVALSDKSCELGETVYMTGVLNCAAKSSCAPVKERVKKKMPDGSTQTVTVLVPRTIKVKCNNASLVNDGIAVSCTITSPASAFAPITFFGPI